MRASDYHFINRFGKRIRDMVTNRTRENTLVEKIMALPPEKISEVEDFVEFMLITHEDPHLKEATSKVSEASFAEVWATIEDTEYD